MKAVRFTDSEVVFEGYPYPGALVHPAGAVAYADIVSFDPSCAPPELRLRSGEVLIVPADQRGELEAAAAASGLSLRRRIDVWALILEPFLDTEFDHDHQQRTLALLEDTGVPRDEALALRESLGPRMLLYNSIHWDWVHLGLADVLDAHLSRLVPAWVPRAHARFRRFYARAMEIAARGRDCP